MFSDAWEVRALLSGLAYIYYHMVCALYVTFLKAAGFFRRKSNILWNIH